MTPDESRLLTDLLDRLAKLPAGYKDPEADALITAAMIRMPHAPYHLVQAYILHEQAAAQAKARIAALEAEVARLRQQAAAPPPAPYGQPPAPAYAPGYAQPAPYAPPATSPWGAPPVQRGGSFLGEVAQTAAGVAGGVLLAEGISSLFSGHHGSPWGGGGWGGGGWGGGGFMSGPTIVENNTTIINEYDNQDDGGDFDDGGDSDNYA